jgi:hypothetical protein
MTQEAQPTPTPPAAGPPAASSTGANRLRIGAVVAVAIAIAVIVWLIVKDDDNGNKSSQSAPPATAASVDELHNLKGSVGHTVYWAGRRPGFTYELTQVGENVYIRYLPNGISLGDPRPNFLTVGSYPTPKAYSVLKRQGRRQGNTTDKLEGGGIAVSSESRPQSVYFAYPDSDVQVEVYDPSASRARRLVLSGRVKPIS